MMRGVLGSEDGQAMVEAAIVLPSVVLLFLMTLQLAMLQQARLIADYAAFAAARTGIVRNGDNGQGKDGTDGPMHDAAVFALLPTYGRTDSFTALAATAARFKAEDAALTAAGLSQVRVFVLNPVAADFKTYGGHLDGQELDFDDVRPGATEATLLSLELRYLYELRVPVANKLIQSLWLAARAVSSSPPDGVDPAALAAAATAGRVFLPVTAFYSMRMQSNPYLKWAHP
jgi:hypothetical protein